MRCWLLLMLGALPAGLALAQTPRLPPQPDRSEPAAHATFSSSRRFLMSGFPTLKAAELARWSEEVARRLEETMGPIPWERGWYVEVTASSKAGVVRAQGWSEGLLSQRLELNTGAELDQEDALEGLVWLLLNRWALIRQSWGARAAELAEVPDWLAVGVAQNLYPESRHRNVEVALERWRTGALTRWSDLVEREILPAGRWSEKAEVALLVAWLLERHSSLDEIWRCSAEGHRLGADEVARRVVGVADAREAARAWEVWLAVQQDRRHDVGSLDLAQVEELEALTRFDETDHPVDSGALRAQLTLADLVAERRSRWAKQLANRRALQFQMAMIGRAPEWQEVARRYLAFLEGIAGRGPGYTGGLFGRGPSARQLRHLLSESDQACALLRRDVQARETYLSVVEASLLEGRAGGEGLNPPDPAVRRYLDEVEQRLEEKGP